MELGGNKRGRARMKVSGSIGGEICQAGVEPSEMPARSALVAKPKNRDNQLIASPGGGRDRNRARVR